ncbi:hypothetical protein ACTXT7_017448 [Hymenolepis weldensis]
MSSVHWRDGTPLPLLASSTYTRHLRQQLCCVEIHMVPFQSTDYQDTRSRLPEATTHPLSLKG